MGKSWGFWLAGVLTWELTLHLSAWEGVARFWPGALMCCAVAALLAVLTGLPGRGGRWLAWALPPVLFVWYAVQLVYHDIFGGFLSLGFVSGGGQAIATFWKVLLAAIGNCLLRLVLLGLVPAGFYLLYRRGFFAGQRWPARGIALAAAAVTVGLLCLHPVLRQPGGNVDRWAERFGVLTAGALDLATQITGGGSTITAEDPVPTEPDETPRNVLPELDLAALAEAAEHPKHRELTDYFAAQRGTALHEYSGYFEGKNLIVVCAEAFSPYVIDPELTPTLYRLSTGGFVFENFYGSFPNLTTNGEYSLCMGLMPDLSRMSFSFSAGNLTPFCLGSQFSRAGSPALAYHNNSGTFYNRINSHPAMGYDFKAVGFGLDMEPLSPTSDLELVRETVDDYLNSEAPFHAYYMTYSGHAGYSFEANDVSAKNAALVKEISGSDSLRGYYACQLELEKAMTYLLRELERAGKAEDTVIVLMGDHIPYGLSEEEYAQLAGEDAVQEPFWQYRNSFICWNGGMEEPVTVDSYCCNQDILPTLLNLFGFSYDSRLLTGRDALAPDEDHLAVLKDGSFLARDLVYDAGSGEARWSGEEDPARLETLIRRAQNAFSVSTAVLDCDYYGFAWETLELERDGLEKPPAYQLHTDVNGMWYEEWVTELFGYGVLNGNTNGMFNGERALKRIELLTMLTRGLRLPAGTSDLPFDDIEPGAWYTDPLYAAWDAGLVIWNGPLLQRDLPLTVSETSEILLRAARYGGVEEPEAWTERTMAEMLRRQRESGSVGVSRGCAAYLVCELLRELELGL